MKRKVTITFEVDPTEYSSYIFDEEESIEPISTDHEPPPCTDTPASVIELVKGMLNQDVDYPDECTVTITCEAETDTLEVE